MQQKQRVIETVRKLVVEEKRCAHCQAEFWGMRNKRHCSQACYHAAYREAHRVELRAKQVVIYQRRKAEKSGGGV